MHDVQWKVKGILHCNRHERTPDKKVIVRGVRSTSKWRKYVNNNNYKSWSLPLFFISSFLNWQGFLFFIKNCQKSKMDGNNNLGQTIARKLILPRYHVTRVLIHSFQFLPLFVWFKSCTVDVFGACDGFQIYFSTNLENARDYESAISDLYLHCS